MREFLVGEVFSVDAIVKVNPISLVCNGTKFLMVCHGGNSSSINHLYVAIQSLKLSGMHLYVMGQNS